MTKKPEFYLKHIIHAISEIESYIKDIDQKEFVSDSMRYNATIRQIEVIGEAISKLESTFTDKYPKVPWQEIKAMRNILIHEYWQTDLEEVYHSAVYDVPQLKELITRILRDIKTSA